MSKAKTSKPRGRARAPRSADNIELPLSLDAVAEAALEAEQVTSDATEGGAAPHETVSEQTDAAAEHEPPNAEQEPPNAGPPAEDLAHKAAPTKKARAPRGRGKKGSPTPPAQEEEATRPAAPAEEAPVDASAPAAVPAGDVEDVVARALAAADAEAGSGEHLHEAASTGDGDLDTPRNGAAEDPQAIEPEPPTWTGEDPEATVNLRGDLTVLFPTRSKRKGKKDRDDAPQVAGDAAEGAPGAEPGQQIALTLEEIVPQAAESAPVVEQEDTTRAHLRGLLEALVFASDKPLTMRELARAAHAPIAEVRELIGELRVFYKKRGIQLDEVAGGILFRTNAVYAPFVRDLLKQKPIKLTRAQLETLAILAYRQPITRPEIDEIRGVDSGPVLKMLLERDLIRMLGKKDEPGRPILYGTTAQFLEFFGLKSLKDMPTLREFTELTDESKRVAEEELGESFAQTEAALADKRAPEMGDDTGLADDLADEPTGGDLGLADVQSGAPTWEEPIATEEAVGDLPKTSNEPNATLEDTLEAIEQNDPFADEELDDFDEPETLSSATLDESQPAGITPAEPTVVGPDGEDDEERLAEEEDDDNDDDAFEDDDDDAFEDDDDDDDDDDEDDA